MELNLIDKTLDLGRIRSCDYKYNKTISFPGAEEIEKENQYELRRTRMNNIFKKYITDMKIKNKTKNKKWGTHANKIKIKSIKNGDMTEIGQKNDGGKLS